VDFKKATTQELKKERHEIVQKMTAALALAKPNMKLFDKLNIKYQKLSDEIRRKNETS
jgi:hypothetical protein